VLLVVIFAAGGATLQVLGPPPAPHSMAQAANVPHATAHAAPPPAHAAPPATPAPPPVEHADAAPAPVAPASPAASSNSVNAGAGQGAPVLHPGEVRIAAPDNSLLESAPGFPGSLLPRIAADGRVPMRVYARPFNPADPRPRVAIIFAGAGMSASETRQAIDTLPGAVTLAFSPYGSDLAPLLQDAREHGHEYLVSIPMEPQGYPLNDPGPRALLTGADPATNEHNLEWSLLRVPGAVGATGALDGMRGERLAATQDPYAMVQVTLSSRGMLYVDPRPGSSRPAHVAGRSVDMVVDDPPNRQDIDDHLAALEKLAREKGSALGLAGPLRPVTVDQITAWASGLEARGVVLVPASALAQPKPGNRI
jgi:uncharacterized protein